MAAKKKATKNKGTSTLQVAAIYGLPTDAKVSCVCALCHGEFELAKNQRGRDIYCKLCKQKIHIASDILPASSKPQTTPPPNTTSTMSTTAPPSDEKPKKETVRITLRPSGPGSDAPPPPPAPFAPTSPQFPVPPSARPVSTTPAARPVAPNVPLEPPPSKAPVLLSGGVYRTASGGLEARCPHCTTRSAFSDRSLLGEKAECPKCKSVFKIDTEVTEESVAPPRRPEASHRPAPQTSRPPKSDGWGWKSWVALAIVAFLFLLIGRRFGPERDVPGETKYLPGKTEYKDTPATLEKLQIAETRRDNLIEQLKEASQKADGAEKAAEDMKASVATETKRADGLQTELNEAMAALKEMAKWGDPEERTDVKPSKAGKVVVEINDPEASGSEQ